jgi:predicted RNA methylase
MKLKELQSRLEQVETFDKPKIQYEQYITTPHLASQIVYNIDQMYDDLNGKIVCDLGCGTGMLSIGCSFMMANYILGIDIDSDALSICRKNLDFFDLYDSTSIDLLQTDVKQLNRYNFKFDNYFDTLVMNPPFGTKNQKLESNIQDLEDEKLKNLGVDLIFLKMASKLTNNSIYSIHKSVTRNYIKNIAKKWNLNMEVVCQLKYNIPKIDTRNRRLEKTANDKDVEVDFLRFTLQN